MASLRRFAPLRTKLLCPNVEQRVLPYEFLNCQGEEGIVNSAQSPGMGAYAYQRIEAAKCCMR